MTGLERCRIIALHVFIESTVSSSVAVRMVDGGGVAGLCGGLLACWLAPLVFDVEHRVCVLLRLQMADLAANECGNKLGRAASGLLGGLARDGRGRISKCWSNGFAAEAV